MPFVTSLKSGLRSILICMGIDHALIDFFAHAAAGAASVVFIILLAGIGIPRRSAAVIRRTHR